MLSLALLLAACPIGTALAATCGLHNVVAPASNVSSESLHETLLLKPLGDGRVLASFEFTLTSTSSSTSSFRLLPRALLQPIQHFGVSEVHLALNSGRWRYDSWGSPVTTLKQRRDYTSERWAHHPGYASSHGRVKLGEESVGTGAEVWARFDSHDAKREGWKGLTSALAGLFCTSLDALDERQTVEPHYAFSSSTNANASAQTLHALLPTEGVCTENLTPFLKLLPCKASAGLATLLNPLSLFSATFHGLAVHVTRLAQSDHAVDADAHHPGWNVVLTFTSVFSPALTRDVSIRDWSISSLFGRTIQSSCPLADSSLVRILKPADPETSAKYQVEPLPPLPACSKPGDEHHCDTSHGAKIGKRNGYHFLPVLEEQDEVTDELASSGLLAFETENERNEYEQRLHKRWAHYLDSVDGEYLYDLSSVSKDRGFSGLDVKMSWPHETRFTYPSTNNRTNVGGGAVNQVVHVERTLIGSGQERSTLQVTLTNTDARLAQRVLWYETLGYFVSPYLHTLRHSIELLPSAASADELLRSVADYQDPVEHITYQPTTSRRGGTSPFVIEAVVRIPASSTVVFTLELKKSFVPYSQHPPDAHRGFDLNPAIVIPLMPLDPRDSLTRHRPRHPANRIPPPRSDLYTSLLNLFPSLSPPPLSPPSSSIPIIPSKSHPRIYSPPSLLHLPTPDFSFVYTNIIFTSTVIALFFGSSLNTLLRTFTDFVF